MTPADRALHAELTRLFGAAYRNVGPSLARRYGGRFVGRGGARLRRYVVHHTAGGTGCRADCVWRYHVQRLGWSTVGYHLMVDRNGRVELMVPPSYMAYGAGPTWNPSSVHVALAGNYNRHDPTAAMLDALYRVLCALDDTVGFLMWRGHRELKATACPGANVMPHLRRMRGGRYGNAGAYGRVRPKHYP